MKIIYKVLLSMVFIASIPLAIYGFWSLKIADEEILLRTREIHLKSAGNLSIQINKYLSDIIENIKNGISYVNFFKLSKNSKEKVLNTLLHQIKVIKGIAVYEGRRIISSQKIGPFLNKRNYKRFIRGQKNKVRFSELKSGTDPFYALIPLTRNRFVSVVLTGKPLREMIEKYTIGKKGGGFIYSNGQVMGRAEPSLNIDEGRDKGVFKASRLMGAYYIIPITKWFVGVFQPEEEVYATRKRIVLPLLFWIGVSLLVAGIIATFLSRGITEPIRKCSKGAEELAKQNLDVKININSKDEIGILARTFNYMASELKKAFEEIKRWNLELEKRVEERTRQLREAHEQLVRSQKMAAVGTLGAGVAHELNNPLLGIIGFAQILLSRKKEGDPDYRALKKIETQAQKSAKIIQSLLSFTERQMAQIEFKPVNLNSTIEASLSLLESQLKSSGIETELSLSPNLPEIYGDFSRLQEVFVHLITNAKNAMPSGGRLELKTRVENGSVKVSVKDTGKGIPEKILPRIFEPFFTTKEEWSGVGLGLAIVLRTVEDHKGKIDVKSEVGKGSTFSITFDIKENAKLKGLTIKEKEIKAHLV